MREDRKDDFLDESFMPADEEEKDLPLDEQQVHDKEHPGVNNRGKVKIQFIFYTFNNPQNSGTTEEEVRKHWITAWALKTGFHFFSLEEGKKGTPHYQGIAMWKNETTLKVVDNFLEKNGWNGLVHIEQCKDVAAAVEYCGHTGAHADKTGLLKGPWHTGVMPDMEVLRVLGSKQTPEKQYMADVLDHTFSERDLMLKHPKWWYKYGCNEGIHNIRQNAREKEEGNPYPFQLPNGKMVYDPQPDDVEFDRPAKKGHLYIWGPANSRKSGWVSENFAGKRVFFARKSKVYPMEGYRNERVVIFDMHKGIKWEWIEQLTEYDSHDKTVPGESRYKPTWMHRMVARTVIILSNDAPCWPGRDGPFNERFWTWELKAAIPLLPKRYMPVQDWGNTHYTVVMPAKKRRDAHGNLVTMEMDGSREPCQQQRPGEFNNKSGGPVESYQPAPLLNCSNLQDLICDNDNY